MEQSKAKPKLRVYKSEHNLIREASLLQTAEMQRVKLEGPDASDNRSMDLEEEKSKARLNVLVTLAVFGAVVAALRVGKYKDTVSMLKGRLCLLTWP